MEFGKGDWKTFEQGVRREWLLTNGIGGFASSTIIGANTRRYHGLLIASLTPPIKRHLIFSKLDESIILDNISYDLYTNQSPGYIGKGYYYLQRFVVDPIPTYFYAVKDVFIKKQICMVYGQNQVVVVYDIRTGAKGCMLKLAPLVNFRDYHFNSHSEHLKFTQKVVPRGTILNIPYMEDKIFVNINEGKFSSQKDLYFYNMDYAMERERGLYSLEDHYIPGIFELYLKPQEHKQITITMGIGSCVELNGLQVIRREMDRIQTLIETAGYQDSFANTLVKACDAFVVKRDSTQSKTILAGYPWFTDWGRDTMIALPGITLVTKRYNDAREILYTFSQYIKDGLVPNMFPDAGQPPLYNSVDAALWYFHAVYKYLQYTNDYKFVNKYLYDGLEQIIDFYQKGTQYHIKTDKDYLIYAGDIDTQLTWMDAKVGDWVVTPRHGKVVEINALWYNALCIMADIAQHNGMDASRYLLIAQQVKNSFEKHFWNEKKQCLFDVINEQGKDASIRPNQIFAVSLDFPVITGKKAYHIVNTVWQHLYAIYGLRSLSPMSKDYRGTYIGDQVERDGAYHQGTAWSWLIGHFITAYKKVYDDSEQSREIIKRMLELFKDHLADACVGFISEIFDGDPPNNPRGCFAQAWGVGEVLRAYVEHIKVRC